MLFKDMFTAWSENCKKPINTLWAKRINIDCGCKWFLQLLLAYKAMVLSQCATTVRQEDREDLNTRRIIATSN
jgi:hypothetical protein